jgi:short-subunit dehydrogenase involved in D-alanine esterification of teichoic acids
MSAMLIIGASSSIGGALAKHYLQQGLTVIWLSRNSPDFTAPKLLQIKAPDLTKPDEWALHQGFFSSVIDTVQQHQVGLIFNCIGWLHQHSEPKLSPEKSLSQSSGALQRKTLLVNLEVPVIYLQGLWPYLTKTQGIRYLQLSAKVGSISDNQLGGWYSNLPAGQLQSPAQTAEHLAKVAQQLQAEQSGLLLNWDGRVLDF